jgi:hypothetical protein
MIDKLTSEFQQPANIYRGQPFWAWNGKLDPDELRRQIRLMRRMGLGGFFMHSRIGLNTPYLQDEWFRCIEACADEAQKLGMIAWLYDEDRWPSGAAGGLVTRDERFRKRSLMLYEYTTPREFKWDDDTLAAFIARVDDATATGVRQIEQGKKPRKLAEGESILAFKMVIDSPSDWYNGYTYLDVLNHRAVQQFIKVTHEAYRKRLGKYFGNTIPGIFTDEPNHGQKLAPDNNTGHMFGLPWTGTLPKTFKQRYGYDLIPHLVELFYDVDGQPMTPARHDYHDCVTFLFVDAFARQIGEWCEQNNMIHIGHVLLEDSIALQTGVVGSCMRFYEYMQAPGMDLLTEHWRAYTTAKQVSSAAHQFGQKWRLTETYGCTGWDFSWVGHKALSDWQTALGINLRCQHLAWYTMEGEAKRDYPAGIFYQSPWWNQYSKVEDYYARVNAVMTRGTEVRDLLVIHPVESMWTMVRKGWVTDPQALSYDHSLVEVESALLNAHIDFDYGDEEIMARQVGVVRRKGQAVLKIGQAEYKAVVVPPLKTMRASTLAMLMAFRAVGGQVVFAGEPCAYVDAEPSDAVQTFAAQCVRVPATGQEIAQAVEAKTRRVSITDETGQEISAALYLLRTDRDADYLFVCNTSDVNDPATDRFNQPRAVERTLAYPTVTIRGFADCAGQPVELDPQTGAIYAATAQRAESGAWEISTSFPALGSRLFVIPHKATRETYSPRPTFADVRKEALQGAAWEVTLSESNNLPLDRPRYRLGFGEWQGPEEILRIDRAARQALGLTPRGGAMVQPWAREHTPDPKRLPVELAYTFEAAATPKGELFLGIEQPQRFRITLNGVEVDTDVQSGWWTDASLKKVPLDPALIRPGTNEIKLAGLYDEEYAGLEIIYLLGNFGTQVDGTMVSITAAPEALQLGDWVPQGLAFYSGSVTYRHIVRPSLAEGERLIVQVPEYLGTAVRVLVDGVPAGIIAWQPNEVDITEQVNGKAEAQLQIEVIGHRRNSHGPLHSAQKWPVGTGPDSFITSGDEWIDGYQLVACGLLQAPVLITRVAQA